MQLDKNTLLRIMEELFYDPNTSFEQDMEAWGIDSDALNEIIAQTAFKTMQELMKSRTPEEIRLTLCSEFVLGFGLGYRCAMELEMNRLKHG